MSDDTGRCACGRFLLLPGGMAQIEDGVWHADGGGPTCEVASLRARLSAAEAARDVAVAVLRECRLLMTWVIDDHHAGAHRVSTASRAVQLQHQIAAVLALGTKEKA